MRIIEGWFELEDGNYVPCHKLDNGTIVKGSFRNSSGGLVYFPEKDSPATGKRVVFANFPYLAGYGYFQHTPITVQDVLKYLRENPNFESAVGHESTAKLISEIFAVECKVNRIDYEMSKDDIVIVLRLNKRQQEGAVLSREDLDRVGYTLSRIMMV